MFCIWNTASKSQAKNDLQYYYYNATLLWQWKKRKYPNKEIIGPQSKRTKTAARLVNTFVVKLETEFGNFQQVCCKQQEIKSYERKSLSGFSESDEYIWPMWCCCYAKITHNKKYLCIPHIILGSMLHWYLEAWASHPIPNNPKLTATITNLQRPWDFGF